MKERKTSTNKTEATKKDIRSGEKFYKATEEKSAAFVGINKVGLYVGLNNGDEVDFISGYEALGFLNTLLNEFDTIKVVYDKKVSQKGTEYETCQPVDYEIAE